MNTNSINIDNEPSALNNRSEIMTVGNLICEDVNDNPNSDENNRKNQASQKNPSENSLSNIAIKENLKKHSALGNGRGRLWIQSNRKSEKMPNLKGQIFLNYSCYFLSGWIQTDESQTDYVRISASIKYIEEEKNIFKIVGAGYLRFSKSTKNTGQPSFRGKITINNERAYSLSAWKLTVDGKDRGLSIYSHPIESPSFSEIQDQLKKWSEE